MIMGFLTSDIAKGWFLAAVRHGLTVGGGWLLSQGIIQQGQSYNDYLGSGLCLAGVLWSGWQEYNHQAARPDKTTGK